MSDATNTRLDVRLVPFTFSEHAAVTRAADGHELTSANRNALAGLQRRMDAAPADPVAAALQCDYWCGDTDDAEREIVESILACLGCALPRNEDHAKETP